MPLITIHTSLEEQNNKLSLILDELRSCIAKQLSCSARELNVNEISIRLIKSNLSKAIADIEIVIIAHSYQERVKNQDDMCLTIKKFVEDSCAPFTVFVWLQLSELGHSA